ncbi:MAG: GNAT family N-acetyltransferase, partial [Thermoplasmata archaeon]
MEGEIGPFTYRKACIEDLQRINELTDVMENYMAGLYGLKLSDADLEEEHYDEDEIDDVFVAVNNDDGTVIGYTSISRGEDEWAGPHYELEHLAIDEDFRGVGIGKHLFAILAQKAEAEGMNITAGTLERNRRALEFYES